MKFFRLFPVCAAFGMIFISSMVRAQANPNDKNAAAQWVKSNVWANGLKIRIYPEVNAMEFKKQYEANKTVWQKALKFLADSAKLATLAPGQYPIDGKNAYATITYAPSKTFEASKWESHQKYIDLQYVITGEEKIGVTPVSGATVTEPYNEKKDVAHYSTEGTYYLATPKEFFLFFPADAHRPNIKVDGYDDVKKLVIKIRYVQ
ncbi:MAG: YhcH/YjgK/YiaL family protein [Bacteroidetes bacterium]|nr:YhcH/YjgK/YiaL family protein [Bacteroidota bacterium]